MTTGSSERDIDTSCLTEPIKIDRWTRTYCHNCGVTFDFTRTMEKEVRPHEKILCSECEVSNPLYDEIDELNSEISKLKLENKKLKTKINNMTRKITATNKRLAAIIAKRGF